jgi:hypothetical protein
MASKIITGEMGAELGKLGQRLQVIYIRGASACRSLPPGYAIKSDSFAQVLAVDAEAAAIVLRIKEILDLK